MIVALLITVIFVLYAIRIIQYFIGWENITEYVPSLDSLVQKPFVSIILPVRNEEKNMPNIFRYLSMQDYPGNNFEIIVTDDHSTDNTLVYCKYLCLENMRIFTLEHDEKGKKAAIKKGILQARGELIVTIDADITISEYWLSTIVSCYNQEGAAMIICPIWISPSSSFIGRFQTIEFSSLLGTTAGAAAIDKPIMCNGANLAFEKRHYLSHQPNQHVSGEDLFLLFDIKKKPDTKITFLKSRDAIAYTLPMNTTCSFFRQRLRWVSKATLYRDFEVKYISVLVLLVNFLSFIFLIFLFFSGKSFSLVIAYIIIKMLVDFPLLMTVAEYFNSKKLMWLYPFYSLAYSFYVTFVFLSSLFIKPTWKGRNN